MKKYLYEENAYKELLNRIEKLNPDTKGQWGKMNPAQMLTHCAEAQEVLNGSKSLKTPFIIKLFRSFIKKLVLSDKPYKKGIKTARQYIVSSEIDFQESKNYLLKSLETFEKQSKRDSESKIHPLFGFMTREEKGWASYKHLDHHLKQFGV